MRKINVLISLLLTGCTVGPNYKTPESTLSDSWSHLGNEEITTLETPLVQWWEIFEDPLLNKYIALATEQNNDLLSATSHILQARALRQMTASSFFPQIGADVNATRTYFSKNGPLFAIGPSVGSIPGTVSPATGLPFDVQAPQTQNLYNVLFDAAWEIDLFGKTRRAVEAANALIGSSFEERNDILLSITAEIARNYIELRGSQKKSQLIEENIQILTKKSSLIHKQLQSGYVSKLDETQIQATLATENALLPDLQAQIYRNIYAISVLTGSFPETLIEELLPFQPLPQMPPSVAIGLRSDLLRRRPDIRKLERDLAAATAHIGVAVAAFFPTFTLIADGGLQSLMLKNLFTMGSKTGAFGGDFNMPIFQGGRLMGNLKAKKAETASIAYNYQQTILEALEETESALISYTQGLVVEKERTLAVDRYKDLVFLSQERNSKGLVNLLNLLDTKRQLNQSEQALLESKTASLLELISLYKALGGGWEVAFTEEKNS